MPAITLPIPMENIHRWLAAEIEWRETNLATPSEDQDMIEEFKAELPMMIAIRDQIENSELRLAAANKQLVDKEAHHKEHHLKEVDAYLYYGAMIKRMYNALYQINYAATTSPTRTIEEKRQLIAKITAITRIAIAHVPKELKDMCDAKA